MASVYETDVSTQDVDADWFAFHLNENAEVLVSCLELVANYIKEHKMLIVGGMSIDFGLRVKGDKLYNEFTIPDYDVVSPDNLDHAKAVGEMLCNKGVKDVAVVPAIHKTTVRVQLLGYTLFDSTFIPRKVYDKIPFLEYNGLRFVDPVYQKIDQYSSLALLWDITGPSFNILNRLKKDLARKEMLNQYYRLGEFTLPEMKSTTWSSPSGEQVKSIRYDGATRETISLKDIHTKAYCAECSWVYHGKIAYAIYYNLFVSMAGQRNVPKSTTVRPSLKISGDKLVVEYWGDCVEVIGHGKDIHQEMFNFVTDKYKATSFDKFTKLATAYQATIVTTSEAMCGNKKVNTTLKMFDMTGHNTGINQATIQGKLLVFSNCNYILSYFLFMHFYSDDESDKQLYGAYYTSLLSMMEHSSSLQIPDHEVNPFDISMNVLGMEYWMDENYDFFLKNFKSLIKSKHNLDTVPPKNFLKHPECVAKKTFDKSKSEFYAEALEPTSTTNFMEVIQE